MENQSQKKVSEIRKNDQQVEKLLLVLAFIMYLFRMQLSPLSPSNASILLSKYL